MHVSMFAATYTHCLMSCACSKSMVLEMIHQNKIMHVLLHSGSGSTSLNGGKR